MSEMPQYAGCYSLDLYCDQPLNSWEHSLRCESFTAETFAQCAKSARKLGWKIFRKTRTARCPNCVKLKGARP